MLNTDFSPWPSFTQEEADAVQRVLLSNKVNYWTGTEGRDFEKEFAAWVGCNYGIAVANGTVALDLALHAIGVEAGDEVITTPRTFLASASSIVAAGAKPIFADVDMVSGNITAETIEPCVTKNTKAIIVVHLAGFPAEMDEIITIAKRYNLFVIEDCAQAHGAFYKGRSVGSIGHIGCWSFCQDKIMTTGGEGGMITTDAHELWQKMWSYKDHGKNYDAVYNKVHPKGFRWLHDSFGTNWRMTEMQAAIGRIQLKRLNKWSDARRNNASILDKVIESYEVARAVTVPVTSKHAYYKYYFYVEKKYLAAGWTRDKIVESIVEHKVPCYHGSCSEIYLEKAFEGTGWRPDKRLETAKELGENSVMLLVHPTLTDAELIKTVEVLNIVLGYAQKTNN